MGKTPSRPTREEELLASGDGVRVVAVVLVTMPPPWGPAGHQRGKRWRSGSLISGRELFNDQYVVQSITGTNYHGAGQVLTFKGEV